MIEMLDPTQPWNIPLPVTWEDPGRELEARNKSDGSVAWRWKWNEGAQAWQRNGLFTHWETYGEIVGSCLDHGWMLFSLPAAPGAETEEGT